MDNKDFKKIVSDELINAGVVEWTIKILRR